MDRLTWRSGKNVYLTKRADVCFANKPIRMRAFCVGCRGSQNREKCGILLAIDRLAAYEDTGMQPEEIHTVKAELENAPLTLTELREMPLQEWLWVEIVHPTKRQRFHGVDSSYYRIFDDYTGGEALCCGWPGTIFEFEFEDYGKNWLAYRHKPEEAQHETDTL